MTNGAYCILVVDDEADFRSVVRFHFEDLGCHVLEAEDGSAALEIFDQQPDDIDLVITDIRMPRMNGEELIREIHARRSYLPIIGVTGHLDIQEYLAVLGQGAYYYFTKPVDRWPIVDRLVENALRLYRHEREVRAIREKEIAISRLLRSYIMSNPLGPMEKEASRHWGHQIALEIKAQPIDRRRPSGDFAEWFMPSGNELVFYIADASGHDDLLSCFMSCLSAIVLHRFHHRARPALDEILVVIEEALLGLHRAEALEKGRHFTFFLGRVNLEFAELDYINAGHPDAFLLRQDPLAPQGVRCHRLTHTGRPVGFFLGQRPEIGRVRLQPGDLLFAYTDGANEMLQGDRSYAAGLDHLEAVVAPLLARTSQEIVDSVAAYLQEQAAEGLPDDTTLLAIKVYAAG